MVGAAGDVVVERRGGRSLGGPIRLRLMAFIEQGVTVRGGTTAAHFEIHHQAFFRGHVTGIRAGMGEPLSAIHTLERLLSTMNPNVLLATENKKQINTTDTLIIYIYGAMCEIL